ncbi:DinB family protein [Clostridium sp. 19966]|uniref:DinB family protein n=1 Tax=Clostridium sp. 19966 TaxID=2768166 RepID=UPI0028DE5883|nr:DinB family protein [Clostridium sp. 19966]MDT8716808.1 DinB family protein [Clostridium sp. 19966]
MDLKEWNDKLKYLKTIVKTTEEFDNAINLFLELHSMVFPGEMSDTKEHTFEDELWQGLEEDRVRRAVNEKGRTIAYGIWHSSRIEDITMNILVADGVQVINKDNWLERINASICDTGNELSSEEILEFSKNININELKNYRIAVGKRSEEIIRGLRFGDFERKIPKERLERVMDEKAVANLPSANWLIDFWGKKDVAGILFMPVTRHHVVHLNENMRAKKAKF